MNGKKTDTLTSPYSISDYLLKPFRTRGSSNACGSPYPMPVVLQTIVSWVREGRLYCMPKTNRSFQPRLEYKTQQNMNCNLNDESDNILIFSQPTRECLGKCFVARHRKTEK